MRPKLKSVVWERIDEELCVVYDRRSHLSIYDPSGGVEALLELLRSGARTLPELSRELGVPGEDLAEAVGQLDGMGLLEPADQPDLNADEQERHFSNLAFFEAFASLSRGRVDFVQRIRAAHVLVLGVGGLNSNTIPHLCGLGVGRLTLVDHDVVQTRNFARQYLYRWSERGQPKVKRAEDWVREFDPAIRVEAIEAVLDGPNTVADLVAGLQPDVVMSGVDQPDAIDSWVNAACVEHKVPFVRAGIIVTEGVVWSVDPGRSACGSCGQAMLDRDAQESQAAAEATALRLYRSKERTNRGIGPVAGLLGALSAFEVLRFLTRFDEPAYAGRPLYIDFAAGCATRQYEWLRSPDCAVCRDIVAPVAETLGSKGGEE